MKTKAFVLLGCVLFLNSCKKQETKTQDDFLMETKKSTDKKFPSVQSLENYKQTKVLATLEDSLQQGFNSVYCVSLLYAWDELKKTLNEPIVVDPKATELSALNRSKSQQDVRSRKDVTFTTDFNDFGVKVFANFKKSLPFAYEFIDFNTEYYREKERLKFNNTAVESFGTIGYYFPVTTSTEVLFYSSDNDFAIKLKPRDYRHEIVLYMPNKRYKSMESLLSDFELKLQQGLKEKSDKEKAWKFEINGEDELFIPKIRFNIAANFSKLIGSRFLARGKTYFLKEVTQQNAFFLDQTGAGIESIVEMEAPACEEALAKIPPKQKLHFDKPFFLMIKKKASKRPYFALWVANTELLVKE
ncbi:hypothetical protein [Flavobacterium sp.]|uniref:hypothetical protein n=1 Tax=Flavobacterium sp. TaxID=239 RepID=UPI00260F65F8|nr:hypothetical protein [Flavobacterium sp.]